MQEGICPLSSHSFLLLLCAWSCLLALCSSLLSLFVLPAVNCLLYAAFLLYAWPVVLLWCCEVCLVLVFALCWHARALRRLHAGSLAYTARPSFLLTIFCSDGFAKSVC